MAHIDLNEKRLNLSKWNRDFETDYDNICNLLLQSQEEIKKLRQEIQDLKEPASTEKEP